MADLLTDANRNRFLTARWNNVLTVGLGVPGLVFALVALTSDSFSDQAAFIGLVIVAAFY